MGYSLFGGLSGTTGGRERGFGVDVSYICIPMVGIDQRSADLTFLLIFFIFQQILGIEMVLVSCLS